MTKDNYVTIKDIYVATQNSEPTLKGKKTLSRQTSFMSRQTQHKVEVNSITTKTSIVVTKVEKNHKKNVVTRKIMLRRKKLCCDAENYVAT